MIADKEPYRGSLRGALCLAFVAATALGIAACSRSSSRGGGGGLPPPSNPTATAGLTSVTLDWTPVAQATGYRVYWSTSPGVTKASGTRVDVTLPPYDHTGLTPGTTYYYVVTSVVGTLEGAESAEVSATPAFPAPTAVSALPGTGEVTVSWQPVAGAGSHTIYWATSPGVTKTTGTPIPSALSPHLHTGLANGTTYYYVVTATDGAFEGPESSEVSATPTIPAPTGVSATPGNAQVTVSWQPVAGASSHTIYWATSSGVTKTTGTPIPSALSPHVQTGLTNGTTYYYVVTATDGAFESPESTEVSATPSLGPSGVLDTTFAGKGWFSHGGAAGGSSADYGRGIAVDAQGRIVVAGGSINTNGNYDMCLWRLRDDGTLDTTFGGVGFVTHDNAAGGSRNDFGWALALDSAGRIVAVGRSEAPGFDDDMVVWRFLDTGVPDASFATGGVFTHHDAAGGALDDQAWGVAIDSQGRIAVGGSSVNAGFDWDVAVWRLLDNGTLDASFGGAGFVVHDNAAGGAFDDVGSGMVVDGLDRILVVGYSTRNFVETDLAIWRFEDTGALDTSFGGQGFVTHHNAGGGGDDDIGKAITLGPSGEIFAAGFSVNAAGDDDVVVWGYDTLGNLIPSFGGGGFATHNGAAGGSDEDRGNGVILDNGGRVLVAGQSANPTLDLDMALWAFTSAGTLDPTFGNGGVFTMDGAAGGNGRDSGWGMAIDGQGRLLVTGDSWGPQGNQDMVVWRFR